METLMIYMQIFEFSAKSFWKFILLPDNEDKFSESQWFYGQNDENGTTKNLEKNHWF